MDWTIEFDKAIEQYLPDLEVLQDEPMSRHRLAAFVLVWCAIALYLADAALSARRERSAAAGRN